MNTALYLKDNLNNAEHKNHPWRRCSIGMHFVKEHLEHLPPSKEHPNGQIITRHAHCAKNPVRKKKPKGEVIIKDLLSFDEIFYISNTYFEDLTGSPTAYVLKIKDADKYDIYIRGWVRYWNEVFKPEESLDPNLIKALMATESTFRIDPPETKQARGLMQVLISTFNILKNPDGELTNHLIHINQSNYLDPSANICAGVRWLFRKKILASHRLKREATWVEAIAEYKSYLADMLSGKNPNPKGMQKLEEYFYILNKNKT